MATLVIYADENDNVKITSENNGETYAVIRAGSGLAASSANVRIGQAKWSGYFYCYEGFTKYYTRALKGSTITAVKEELYLSGDNTDVNFLDEVRTYDWGTALTTDDWVAGANLGDSTLVSSKTISPSAGYNEYPTSANFVSAINQIGFTQLMHSSERMRLDTEPTTFERVDYYSPTEAGTTTDPKLTVTYTPPAGNNNGFFALMQ